jgi:oxysterol-binding protein-related protein 3/6/7
LTTCKPFHNLNSVAAGHATAEDSRSDTSSSLSPSDSSERVLAALNSLKAQHAALLKSLKILSLSESYQPSAPSSGLPFTAEEENCQTPVVGFSPTFKLGNRSSVATSFTDTVNEWYDAHDGLDGAEEFVLDSLPSSAEAEHVNHVEVFDSHSSLDLQESSADSDAEEEVSATLLDQESLSEEAGRLVKRRSRLAVGPVADEGSLFAILKKNVGKVNQVCQHGLADIVLTSACIGSFSDFLPCDIQRTSYHAPENGRRVGIL